MASVREVKSRIKSVRNIQQITKAMKMVAAARIKKAEQRLKAAKPYTQKLGEVLDDLVGALGESAHPLMASRPVKKVMLVVVASDKGLCGSFNSNLLKRAQQFIGKPPHEAQVEVLIFGSKALRYLQRRKVAVRHSTVNFKAIFAEAQEAAQIATDAFLQGEVDQVHLLYTEMISVATQAPKLVQVLPLTREGVKKSKQTVPYTFDPSPDEALGVIIPRYLEATFFLVLLESRAAELTARLRAMSNATDNADKLASSLTLQYFRARQDQITGELIEISSGAASLRK
ncbi:MAG TPA: ATP synthase F1 subunit gamma [Candidatus Xenobia bacterium]|jgi:F-type H+-transporting ATPase subunit gamma